ncbi:MAG TPA: class I SAM-dependent methyltransferase [Polyangiaceae bacterium]
MTTKFVHQEPFTEQLLVDAGVTRGMRVVDLGCGGGDVSCLLAKLVGEEGQVIGVDRDGASLARARENAACRGLSNTTFVQRDLSEPLPDLHSFDAAVARRVLMYLPNPVDTLRRVAAALRSDGLAIFQEADATMTLGRQSAFPLHDRVNEWIWQTVVREGANVHIGFDLPRILEQAGFKVQRVRAVAEIEYGADQSTFQITRAMQARIVQQGVATEAEIDLETLEERLETERTEVGSIYVRSMSFGAWARKVGA